MEEENEYLNFNIEDHHTRCPFCGLDIKNVVEYHEHLSLDRPCTSRREIAKKFEGLIQRVNRYQQMTMNNPIQVRHYNSCHAISLEMNSSFLENYDYAKAFNKDTFADCIVQLVGDFFFNIYYPHQMRYCILDADRRIDQGEHLDLKDHHPNEREIQKITKNSWQTAFDMVNEIAMALTGSFEAQNRKEMKFFTLIATKGMDGDRENKYHRDKLALKEVIGFAYKKKALVKAIWKEMYNID